MKPYISKMDSMDFQKPPGETRIVVAMSGGVDSSVTAALLAEQGYDVVGITLQLYDSGSEVHRKGACCAGQDIYDARNVADAIGIPHYVLNYETLFRESVIDAFADSYVAGETPIPCVTCNQTVKFRDLLAKARDLDADALATGHYVRRIAGPDGPELHRGVDPAKDQSYFLFATTRDQIDFLRFPLGGMSKDIVREHAARLSLPVATKPDSQDICFVPNGDYASIVAKLRPGSIDPGDIVDRDGRVLAHHDGIINFTIGQRRGIGIGGAETPLYVLRIEPDTHRVVVAPRAALARDVISLHDVNWLGGGELPTGKMKITAKMRSTQLPVSGVVQTDSDGGAVVELTQPEFGISPGQACVLYDGDRVLGGGWINRDQAA